MLIKYQLVTSKYMKDGSTRIYARDENYEKIQFEIFGHQPYFYVPADFRIKKDKDILDVTRGYEDLWKRPVKKITVSNPLIVSKIRKNYPFTYEADIVYAQRVLIDMGISSIFTIDGRIIEGLVSYSNLKHISTAIMSNPLACGIDIEVDTSSGFPNYENPIGLINCVTVHDTVNNHYYTLLVKGISVKIEKDTDWSQIFFVQETDMLKWLLEYFRNIKPDVFYGWYISFDINYLSARIKHLGMNWDIEGYMLFDLIPFFRKIRGRSFGNKLKEVVIEELIDTNPVLGEYDNELWLNPERHEELMLYNKNDVMYCVIINKKYPGNGITCINFFWRLKCRSGHYDIEQMQYNSRIIDVLLLRVSKEWKAILPSVSVIDEEESYDGGIVVEPRVGLHYDCAILDMSMFYPSTTILGNFSPEYSGMSIDERISKKLGIVPALCKILINDRLEANRKLNETMIKYDVGSLEYSAEYNAMMVIKYLLNAVYGFFAFKKCRLYDKKMVAEMVAFTRFGMKFIMRITKKENYSLLYADTDGIFIKIDRENILLFLDHLNNCLSKLLTKNSLEPIWSIKYETYCDRILFAPAKKAGSVKAAKKRYAYRVIEKDGKKVDPPKLLIKGFDAIRGNESKLTKKIQRECFDAIFNDTTGLFIDNLKKIIHDLKKGKYPVKDISIPVNLSKRLDEYKSNTDFIRGVKFMKNVYSIDFHVNDRVKMLFVKRVDNKAITDVICYKDEETIPQIEINYEKLIDRCIKGKVESLINIVGYTWSDVNGQKKLTKFLE